MNTISTKRTIIRILAVLFFIFSLCIIIISILVHLGILLFESLPADIILIPGLFLGALSGFCSYGLLHYKDWARSIIVSISLIVILVFFISAIFEFSTIVFAGKEISQVPVILKTFFICFFYKLILKSSGAIIMLFLFRFLEEGFTESQAQRNLIDRMVRYILLFAASSSILIVLFIFIFTFLESTDAITEIGLDNMLLGTIWRPGSIIGNDTAQFGLVPMVIGSIYSTIGAVIFGVPLSLGTAILLAEIAPPFVREIFRPAVELLAGIPSVIFGLFGLIIIAPLIRKFKITGNTGFGILNASIVLAIMILPTVTNIAEDAIRAVPDSYRRASLAIGATKWQTIKNVILPSARSGIIAAVILGIGRALGETMALIMVIGNSIAIPKPLNENPLTLFFSTARTLTGNIAVEINYAAGVHRSALFFTGVLLFILLLVINRIANYLMREKKPV